MSREIWKFPLGNKSLSEIEMPEDAQFLKVGSQHGEGFIWAIVNTKSVKVKYLFRIIGTGHPLPDDISSQMYKGTFFLDDANYVYHVFSYYDF